MKIVYKGNMEEVKVIQPKNDLGKKLFIKINKIIK
jgi:hypothetical protein